MNLSGMLLADLVRQKDLLAAQYFENKMLRDMKSAVIDNLKFEKPSSAQEGRCNNQP
jgi:hypothetical protein